MANQNITLSLPEEDLRDARILAARRGTSVSQLLARLLRETVERETGYDAARERSLARLREGADLGTRGRLKWSRDYLHERQSLQEFFVATTRKIPKPIEALEAARVIEDLAHWHVHAPAAADVLAAIDLQLRTGFRSGRQ
jgi:hypothetical protein